MALLHRATLSPTKVDMLSAWAPHQPWWTGGLAPLTVLGAYRFDDPGGEVGIETFLIRVGDGPVLQVPLTYRAAPLPGVEDRLVTEMDHSVLGRRWVHCGCDDPVYAAALLRTVLTGGSQADLEVDVDGERQVRETTTFARGSGVPGAPVPPVGEATRREEPGCTVLQAGGHEITVCRTIAPGTGIDTTGARTLTGRWPGRSQPTLLAVVR